MREKTVSVLEQKATNPSKIEKLFGGKSVESQALEITLQKKKGSTVRERTKRPVLLDGQRKSLARHAS
jgi:hypothetical protein